MGEARQAVTAVAAPVRPGAASRVAALARRVRTARRGDLVVVAFCALAAGNLWARRGTGNPVVAPSVPAFMLGFGLIVVAAATCYVAAGRPWSLPSAGLCSVAIAAQACLAPTYILPTPQVYVVGVAFALVPLVRWMRVAWLLIAAGAAVTAAAVAGAWTWGVANIDVFTEVQGSTGALLHGQNPYAAVYKVFLGWHTGGIPYFGSGSFCYGPMVVVLSLPARILGDVRVMVVALNLATLGALLVWARRGTASHRLAATITALLASSPYIPFMVLTEWTDSFGVAGLAWWLVLRDRHRGWATAALTLGVASKPSMLLVLLPLIFWTSAARRELVWAAAATVAILAPFALWTGIPQFVYDTVGVFGDLPARTDGITVDGLSVVIGHGLVPGALLALGVAAGVLVFLRRRPHDYGTALAAGAGMLIVVCLFGKQAFLNYYYIAGVGLLFTVGGGMLSPRSAIRSPVADLPHQWRSLSRLGHQEAVAQSEVLTESGFEARASTR